MDIATRAFFTQRSSDSLFPLTFFYYHSIFLDDHPRPSSQGLSFEYSPGLFFFEACQVGKPLGRREAEPNQDQLPRVESD
jgi:hypothetical protein